MSRGRVPKIILCGAQTHKTEYITDQIYASEAEHMQAIIRDQIYQYRELLSSKNFDDMSTQERRAMAILDQHEVEQMFALEDRSSDTEKNLLELSKQGVVTSPKEYVLVTSQSHIHRAHYTQMQMSGSTSPAV